MSYNRYRYQTKQPQFGTSHIYTTEDGTVVHDQYGYSGRGWHHYHFIGTLEGITAQVEAVKRRYPTAGYGTQFNWPPGRTYQFPESSRGKLIEHEQPEEISPGLWHLWGSHSNSSD